MKNALALLIAVSGFSTISFANRPMSRTEPSIPSVNSGVTFGLVRDLIRCKSYVVNPTAAVAADGLLDMEEVDRKIQNARDLNDRGQWRRRAVEQCVTCDSIDISSGDTADQKLRCLREQASRLSTIKNKKWYSGAGNFYQALLLNTIEINLLDKSYDPDYISYARAFRSEARPPFYNIDGSAGVYSFSTEPDATLWFREPYRTLIFVDHVMLLRPGVFEKYFATLPDSQKKIAEEGMLKKILQGWSFGEEVARALGESPSFRDMVKRNYIDVERALESQGGYLGGSLWILHAYSDGVLERIKASIAGEEELQGMRMKVIKGEGGLRLSVETLESLGRHRAKIEELLEMDSQSGQISQQSMLQHLNRAITGVALENDLALSDHLKRMMGLAASFDVDGAALLLKPLLWSGQGGQFVQLSAHAIQKLPYARHREDMYRMLKRDLPELRIYQGRIGALLRAVDDVELSDTANIDRTVESLISFLSENSEFVSVDLRGNLLSELTNSLFQDTEDRLAVLRKVKSHYRTKLEQLLTDIRKGMKELSKIDEVYKIPPPEVVVHLPCPGCIPAPPSSGGPMPIPAPRSR